MRMKSTAIQRVTKHAVRMPSVNQTPTNKNNTIGAMVSKNFFIIRLIFFLFILYRFIEVFL